jgi:hypothetical protein
MKGKIFHWLGIIACITIIISCFLPWTYHADVSKTFTGFFSEKSIYGKPGKFIIFFAVIILVFMLLPRIWAKRTNLFMAAFLLSYAVKTYTLYSSCYNAYCPDKKTGLFIMLISSIVIMLAAVFPHMKIPTQENKLNSNI